MYESINNTINYVLDNVIYPIYDFVFYPITIFQKPYK